MAKNYFFPKIEYEYALRTQLENGLRRCFSPGSFAIFERSGFAASGLFCAGCVAPPPPPPAARLVRTNSSILHQTGKRKSEATASLRSAAKTHCNFGLNSNWRFRIREKIIFGHSFSN